MSLQNPASTAAKPDAPEAKTSNFLRQIIEHDLAAGTYAQRRWSGSPGDAAHHATGVPDARRHQRARCIDTQRHDGIAAFEHGRCAPQCFGKIACVRKMQAQ